MEDIFGPWRTIEPKLVLQLDIRQRLLISIGVQHTFLLVILVFPQNFFIGVVFSSSWAIYGHYDCCLPVILFCSGVRRMFFPSFDHVLFQALLHHCFVVLLQHIAVVLKREKVYLLEFTFTSVGCKLSINFWEGKDLVTMTIAQ